MTKKIINSGITRAVFIIAIVFSLFFIIVPSYGAKEGSIGVNESSDLYESENPTGIDISEDPTLNIPSEPEISDDSENYKNSAKDAAKIQKSGKKYVENEILVKFRDEEGLTENLKEYARDKVHKKVGGTLKKDYKKSGQEGLHLVVVPEGVSVEEMIDEYQNDPSVEYAQPNYILSLPSSPIELNPPSGEIPATDYPDDTYFPLQWALSNSGQEVNGNIGTSGADIGILQAWDVTRGDEEVIIAVIDIQIGIIPILYDSKTETPRVHFVMKFTKRGKPIIERAPIVNPANIIGFLEPYPSNFLISVSSLSSIIVPALKNKRPLTIECPNV